eukprot:scaffold163_cov168-Alexandrium_tamarense.AAC.2
MQIRTTAFSHQNTREVRTTGKDSVDLTYEDSKGTSSTMKKQTKLFPLEKRPNQHNRSISSPFSVDVNQQSSISSNCNIPILPTPDPMPGDCD